MRVLAVIVAALGTSEACGRGLTIARQGNRGKGMAEGAGGAASIGGDCGSVEQSAFIVKLKVREAPGTSV